ncbi:Germacrene A synthase [Porphyridium purpureum]|uniref:Terpene synthase n=1 Tax=Porphyridium purpureum TaxID=35688 RepID=A0A385AJM7_PORPP|nr:terpene synthase [Porphyridium purpureum]KAA8493343.1 Germacrene A synthase [Porphyridium purpureum]|eukprot:POR1023..scf296_7
MVQVAEAVITSEKRIHESEEKDARPALRCDLSVQVHPHEDDAFRETLKWATSFGLIQPGSKAYAKVQRARFSMLIASTYPYVTRDQLQLMSDFALWLFAYDDASDNLKIITDTSRLAALVELEDRMIGLLQNRQGVCVAEQSYACLRACKTWPAPQPVLNIMFEEYGTDCVLIETLQDLMVRFTSWASEAWLARWTQHMEEYLLATRFERSFHLRGETMTPNEYIPRRMDFSAVNPCLDMTGAFLKLDCEMLSNNACIAELEKLCNKHISWVNDLYGLKRDVSDGTNSNLVLCILHHTKNAGAFTVQDASDIVVQSTNFVLEEFVDLSAQVPLGLESYVHAMEFWMSGSLFWHQASARYNSKE